MDCFSQIILYFLAFAGFATSYDENMKFSYREDNPLGPSHWHKSYEECGGRTQSPINIETKHIEDHKTSKDALKFHNFEQQPKSLLIENIGQTVKYTFEFDSCKPCVQGETITQNQMYCFDHLHFHWGSSNQHGSEHQLNSKSYAMEMHMVFFNSNLYRSIAQAKEGKEKSALVIGVFFKVRYLVKNIFSTLAKYLPDVTHPHDKKTVSHPPITLAKILDGYDFSFATYNGSLTTPPCTPNVIWVVLRARKFINHFAIEQFRKLKGFDGAMSNNYRPIQPLNDRNVVFYD